MMTNNKCMNPACRREISKRVMYCPDCAKSARDRINGVDVNRAVDKKCL